MVIGLLMVVFGFALMWFPMVEAGTRAARAPRPLSNRRPPQRLLGRGEVPARLEVWGLVGEQSGPPPVGDHDAASLRQARDALALEVERGLAAATALEQRFMSNPPPAPAEIAELPPAANSRGAGPDANQTLEGSAARVAEEASGSAQASLRRLGQLYQEARAALAALEAHPCPEHWVAARASTARMVEVARATRKAEESSRASSIAQERRLLAPRDLIPSHSSADSVAELAGRPLGWAERAQGGRSDSERGRAVGAAN